MNADQHKMLPIGAMPLHPYEALIVAIASKHGQWVRQCSCRLIVSGINEIDLHCHYRAHLNSVKAARQ